MGLSSWSQEMLLQVVGATSSEGFLVYHINWYFDEVCNIFQVELVGSLTVISTKFRF